MPAFDKNQFIPAQWKKAAKALPQRGASKPRVTMTSRHVLVTNGPAHHRTAGIFIDYATAPAQECGGLTTAEEEHRVLWSAKSPLTAFRNDMFCGGVPIGSDYSGDPADVMAAAEKPRYADGAPELASFQGADIKSLLPMTDKERASAVLAGIGLREGWATATDGKTAARRRIQGGTADGSILAPWACEVVAALPDAVWHLNRHGLFAFYGTTVVTVYGPVLIDATFPPMANIWDGEAEQVASFDVDSVLGACAAGRAGIKSSEVRSRGHVGIVIDSREGTASLLSCPSLSADDIKHEWTETQANGFAPTGSVTGHLVYFFRASYLETHAKAIKTQHGAGTRVELHLGKPGHCCLIKASPSAGVSYEPEALLMPINMPDHWHAPSIHATADVPNDRRSDGPPRNQSAVSCPRPRSLAQARDLAGKALALLDGDGIPVSGPAARDARAILEALA